MATSKDKVFNGKAVDASFKKDVQAAYSALEAIEGSRAKAHQLIFKDFHMHGVEQTEELLKQMAVTTYGSLAEWPAYANFRQIKSRWNKAVMLALDILKDDGSYLTGGEIEAAWKADQTERADGSDADEADEAEGIEASTSTKGLKAADAVQMVEHILNRVSGPMPTDQSILIVEAIYERTDDHAKAALLRMLSAFVTGHTEAAKPTVTRTQKAA